jgi:protein-tyrosine phosphatase
MTPFAILVVCTGNQCRSPVAEHVVRETAHEFAAARRAGSAGGRGRTAGRALGSAGEYRLEVMSAGTQGTVGQPIHALTARAMQVAGLSVPEHSSAPLTADAVRAADLILTAERTHRTMAAAMADGAAARTFTLLEFAALLDDVMQEGEALTPPELVQACAQVRAGRRGLGWSDPRWDLPDPITGDAALHLAVLQQVLQASSDIAQALTADMRGHVRAASRG